jgi:hypothetical protein
MTAPTSTQLRSHERRIAGMLRDPECVGELLLVGIGMARSIDLGDPHWPAGESMPLKPIAYAVYGRYMLGRGMLLPDRFAQGDSHPRKRILDVFFHDRRRYSATVDGDRNAGWSTTCGRPMLRRAGLCGRSASWDQKHRLTDPATGKRHTVGACSQPKCRAWYADLLARNAVELKAHPAPEPAANTGGVLERHLPEIDWWKVWGHVDKGWKLPPEGERFQKPTLRLVLGDDGPVVTTRPERPALVVHEGGWR